MISTTKCAAISATIALAVMTSAVQAQDGPTREQKARQGQFNILAINLGALGAMAKGDVAYDAFSAQIAASSLAAIARLDQSRLWPEGSDNAASSTTRAKPDIWSNPDDFAAKWAALGVAAETMEAAAAQDAAAIGEALKQVGGACKSCHETYRAPKN